MKSEEVSREARVNVAGVIPNRRVLLRHLNSHCWGYFTELSTSSSAFTWIFSIMEVVTDWVGFALVDSHI